MEGDEMLEQRKVIHQGAGSEWLAYGKGYHVMLNMTSGRFETFAWRPSTLDMGHEFIV